MHHRRNKKKGTKLEKKAKRSRPDAIAILKEGTSYANIVKRVSKIYKGEILCKDGNKNGWKRLMGNGHTDPVK